MPDSDPDLRAVNLYKITSPQRLTRIVDVGANPLDDTPYARLLRNGLCEVWGFEPQPEAYKKLMAEKGSHEHYFPYAVGSGQPGTLHVCRSSGFTSLKKPNMELINLMGHWESQMTVLEEIDMETRQLDSLEDLPEFDLLKIDVQGSEIDVFKGGRRKLSHVSAVITEVATIPLYEDQPLLDAQMQEMRENDFHLHKFLFLKSFMVGANDLPRLKTRRNRNQAVDGDVVFLKNLFKIREYPSEQLKHLALLADSAFESFDIAVLALQILADRNDIDAAGVDAYIDMLPANLTKG
ncbi:FkbM family methyltransferase [Celeribacter sp. ULVN23_4]